MYNIGDKIFYPSHGAGVIEKIEERKVLGKKRAYYIMKMPYEDMKVMLPAESGEEIGMRFVIGSDEGKRALERFRDEPICNDDNWNRHQRDNMEKIKSGDIYQVLTVVKNLMFMDKKKGLSTSERKLLGLSRQIFISEIVLSGAADKSDVEGIMEDTVQALL